MVYYPENYIVYTDYGEPVGLMVYGGQYYYSDDPPWLTPQELAEGIYKKKRVRTKVRVVPAESVSEEVWETARENERSRKYRKA